CRREGRLHHTGQPLGNGYIESFDSRLRAAQWRDLVHAQGGEDRDRKLAPKHRAASRSLGLSCAGAEANAGVLWAVIAIKYFFLSTESFGCPGSSLVQVAASSLPSVTEEKRHASYIHQRPYGAQQRNEKGADRGNAAGPDQRLPDARRPGVH